MSGQPSYLLDADSFIRSKREHYAFDFCPGFWEALLDGFAKKRLSSIVPIRKELLRGTGKDALATWVKDEVPEEFFASVEDPNVQDAYAKVVQWVEGHKQYSRAAKQKFVRGADPWLVADALVNRLVLVTYEVSSPESKAFVKLPDVAAHFKVACIPPYVLLRQLNVQLTLQKLK
jgi:hypothetical protein